MLKSRLRLALPALAAILCASGIAWAVDARTFFGNVSIPNLVAVNDTTPSGSSTFFGNVAVPNVVILNPTTGAPLVGLSTITANSTPFVCATAGSLLFSDGALAQCAGAGKATSIALGGATIGAHSLATAGSILAGDKVYLGSATENVFGTGGFAVMNGSAGIVNQIGGVNTFVVTSGAASVTGTLTASSLAGGGTRCLYVDNAGLIQAKTAGTC